MATNYFDAAAFEAAILSLERLSERIGEAGHDLRNCVSQLKGERSGLIDQLGDDLKSIAVAVDDCSEDVGALSGTLAEILQVYLQAEERAYSVISSSDSVPLRMAHGVSSGTPERRAPISRFMSSAVTNEPWLVSLALNNGEKEG